MISLDEPFTSAKESHLRPLDLTRDLDQVADLIEACFSDHMDPDGKEYLRQMRRMARDAYLLRRAVQATGSPFSPLAGFVWEEGGDIVGNLSLIPAARQGKRINLIANVAVHPDYRRRGIARMLTEAAIARARQQNASACWLQVREGNIGAIDLYVSLGFVERARRTTWLSQPGASPGNHCDPQVIITSRYSTDWARQKAWMNAVYSPEISWNLNLDFDRFKPGFWNALGRFLTVDDIRHWAARIQNNLIGILTWQPSRSFADSLWLAAGIENENRAILSLLPAARRSLNPYRPLSLNFPAGRAVEAFQTVGFVAHQTLIWMELPFESTQKIIMH